MNFLRLFWDIVRDERGAAWIPAAIMGASTILGSVLGKNKQTTKEPFPGYYGMAEQLASKVRGGIMGQGTKYPGSFNIPQPGVEAATESQILKGLAQPPSISAFSKDITDKYKRSQIADIKERAGERTREEENVYNKLGLTTSSPWLKRRGEIGRDTEKDIQSVSARFDYEDIGREIEANKLVADIMNQYVSQGQVLGQSQRGYSQYPIGMGYQDWVRAYEEPYKWAGLGANILGSNAPVTTTQPNIWSQLAQGGQDIGSMMMMSQILGGGNKLSGGSSSIYPGGGIARLTN